MQVQGRQREASSTGLDATQPGGDGTMGSAFSYSRGSWCSAGLRPVAKGMSRGR